MAVLQPTPEDPLPAPAPAGGERIRLADGGELLVRPLRASDRGAYASSMRGMSARSRYLRFASPKPRLSDRELDFLTGADGDHHLALVAIAAEPARGVAVARYVRGDARSAEVAIGVTDAWQGRGLGRLLLSRLLEQARAHGVTVLTATTLAENVASERLLHAAGFRLARRDGTTNDYRLELPSTPVAA